MRLCHIRRERRGHREPGQTGCGWALQCASRCRRYERTLPQNSGPRAHRGRKLNVSDAGYFFAHVHIVGLLNYNEIVTESN